MNYKNIYALYIVYAVFIILNIRYSLDEQLAYPKYILEIY